MRKGQPQRSARSATTRYSKPVNYTSAHDAFVEWADANGVAPPQLIPWQWIRTNSPHKSYKDKSLGVLLKDDCILVKDHLTGELRDFQEHRQHEHVDNQALRAEIIAKQSAAAKQKAKIEEQAAKNVTKAWAMAIDAEPSGYMLDKGLTSCHRARWSELYKCWLILLSDVHGKPWSAQKIYNRATNNKRFWPKGRLTGCFALLGELDATTPQIGVAEGFATGASIRQANGKTIACAMHADNLQPVCEAIRAAYPSVEIIVCSDDDRGSALNKGRQKGIEAAQAVNGKIAFPTFCDGCNRGCTDFNDAINCKNKEASR